MEEMCREFQMRCIPTAVQHPESNGFCERGIGTMKSQLNKGTPILQALYNYYYAFHSVTKRTTIALLYGLKDKNPIELSEPTREETLVQKREVALDNNLLAKRRI